MSIFFGEKKKESCQIVSTGALNGRKTLKRTCTIAV
jgi:hypothetical protein